MEFSFVLDTVGNNRKKEVFPSFTLNEQDVSTTSSDSKGSLIEQLKAFREKLSVLSQEEKPKETESRAAQNAPNVSKRSLKKAEWLKKQRVKAEERKPEVLRISTLIGKNLSLAPLDSKPRKLEQEVKKALQKAVVTEDFEELKVIPPYEVPKKRLHQERKNEREKTKGKNWFNLPATEMTEEVKQDLEVLQMRSVLDPKHFYKKNDLKVLPKYFQVGKVMDSPLDYYNNRMTKKERKKTLVDELLADAEFQKYNKRKYQEIIEEKQKTHYKSWRNAKKLKKKK